jgi:hypothetical protein
MAKKKERTIKVRIHARTWKLDSHDERIVEVDADEWADMSQEERNEFCREELFNVIEWGWDTPEEDAKD